jgi:plasmid stabilization system protein ParE
MNKFKLIINPFAEQDILEARSWYNEQQEDLDNELLHEIKRTIKIVQSNPYQFPIIKWDIRRAILKRFPYSIFFIVSPPIINVFALFHNSRNPKIWKSRKP